MGLDILRVKDALCGRGFLLMLEVDIFRVKDALAGRGFLLLEEESLNRGDLPNEQLATLRQPLPPPSYKLGPGEINFLGLSSKRAALPQPEHSNVRLLDFLDSLVLE